MKILESYKKKKLPDKWKIGYYNDSGHVESLYERIRNQSQPQKVNCCGSIFKNPKNHSAWKLIKSSIDDSFYNGPIKLMGSTCNNFTI